MTNTLLPNLYSANRTFKKRLYLFLISVALLTIFNVISFITFYILHNYGIDIPEKNSGFKKMMNDNSIYSIIFYVAIYGPILEEFLFRAWLKFEVLGFVFLTISIIYFPLSQLKLVYEWLPIALLLVAFPVFYLLFIKTAINKYLKRLILIKHNIKVLLYILSSLIFGIVHITNADKIHISTMLFCIPHIFAGLIFGYLRIKNGLIWAIALHILNNLILVLI
jgi:membrane protease YdiL (CAAX protease family)